MKLQVYLFLLIMTPVLLFGQNTVQHQGITETDIDLSNVTTVGQTTINPSVSGKVIVSFDGYCTSSQGDRIILAASNTQDWNTNDGAVSVEAVDSDVDRNSFSHTQVYDVNSGSHTFYAVAENYVETAGDGVASIYGSLTVEFIPDGNETFVEHQGITETDLDVSSVATLGQTTINPSVSGKVIVSFDGYCTSSQGDRIILAASDNQGWNPNDGAVSVEAVDSDVDRNSFSHTRVYDVNSGSHTFYAVAENYVETAGDGMASIYGSLTVEFIPDGNETFVEHQGITETDLDVSSVATLGQTTINPSVSGKVIVSFDGYCTSSQGDRIILAASDNQGWNPNDGAVSVEAVDSDVDRNSFSHTRVYDVNSGSHTFYAVAENYVETDGDGVASIYGSLTVEFIPDLTTSVNDLEAEPVITFYPNPSSDFIEVVGLTESKSYIIYNKLGAKVKSGSISDQDEIDIRDFNNGLYFLKFDNGNTFKFIKE